MRMKSLILIFIALGCGLVASIGISQVMNRDAGPSLEMDQILVALADIDIGSKLDAQNVKLEDWPKAKIPEGAVRKLEDVKDKFANARFFKGEPLHVNKISDTLTNIANKVPAGYRAMPVKVDEDTVMKGISPGDRVDVMVFLKRNGADIPETGAFTILKNVRVFAVNTNTERANEARGETVNFKTISLLVKPEHARELAVAMAMGKIMLTLRRPDENDEAAGEEVTPLNEILSGRSKLASEPVAAPAAPQPGAGFMGFVQNAAATEPPAPPTDIPPLWKMELISPSDRKVFEWRTDKNQLPVEASFGVPRATPAGASSNNTSTAAGAGSSDGKTDTKSTDTKSPIKTDDSSSTQAEAKTGKDGK
jgi:pilus assembly protein CpaB